MYKKKYDFEESKKKMKRRMVVNWVIMFVSLGLMILCYYFVK